MRVSPQSIRLVSAEVLSAGALLGRGTPTIVALGSCFGARLPLGLATVCLTQGTRTVLGPILDVDDPVASEILTHTYTKLTALSPAEALRDAQLSYLSSHPNAAPRGWGVLVALGISTATQQVRPVTNLNDLSDMTPFRLAELDNA